ncbi:MAG: peptide deformylase [Candidatus Margulisiibacteriota bacterium]|nr:MAG: peptide deformylase [Candidatus Margulisbacteria bacterium GWD2_39_127]OGI01679.1 MAG: peptide deformylase [Candidatus Margulisbacteria bacterium GWF2_38_17]OGI05846.1 MAG: peptide deformylase [Candidatus Margulisbacteria bacterium GWE2_39_32]PZM81844.1 MAG: peptide deformylase [Candidatus Margulisiibacteriota bacterium]HAR63101.1 peptide deformylase [Candidatus Margulisiibacteriota bacterium]
MTRLHIVPQEDPLIRKKSKAIDRITPELKSLAKDMLETMYSASGVGLAAVQVGFLQRMVVIDVSENRNEPLVLINPRIVSSSGKVPSKEGCLSVQGIEGVVARKERVVVKARNIDNVAITFEADGLFAICLQHEIDHLEGVLFIDRLIDSQHEQKQ